MRSAHKKIAIISAFLNMDILYKKEWKEKE